MKEDNISQLGDYDVPFFEQQYMDGCCYISLFKFKTFDQLIPAPQTTSNFRHLLSCGTMVRSDSQIEGMIVFGKEVLLTSFADDATYFLLNIASVYQLFRVFDEFQAYSFLKVSGEKSEISGLGLATVELVALCGCK